ncbi:type I-E CRISPR-associated endoribonuclease Cas2 [Nocardioides albidus]|uniref:Type I-E CRISPR-associated endoribonuclease Cas2 n=1 Tax=Nocardioides albidus TaxID=1517589 RepID=A0A5C4VQS7_9ACTN|nr:type I-E CRISPR-associated endoribonuclease Cas2e [Nocardioides albidus]TNM38293.1 type I-E CRISPR-associated endoribonuclease Cas2 [Nocardioides albidus]
MVVLVLTACPAGLRGHLTRWLLEVSPGVFVGQISARVRDLMWARVLELSKDGRAIMVFHADTEQGLAFRVHRHDWQVVDVDGLSLMLRPHEVGGQSELRPGWSSVARARRARRRK